MIFKTQITLPVSKKSCFVKCYNNATNENLQKYLIENHERVIENMFNELIDEHTEGVDVKYLTNLDKFIILCKLRCTSYGNIITLSNGQDAQITIDIEKIIDDINQVPLYDAYIKIKSTELQISFPLTFVHAQEEAYSGLIYKINNDFFVDLSLKHRDLIIAALDKRNLPKMHEFISTNSDALKQVKFISNINQLNIGEVAINPFDSSLFSILKIMYQDNLTSLYQIRYNCLTKLNISCSDYNELVPIETKLLISLFSQELEKRELLKNEQN